MSANMPGDNEQRDEKYEEHYILNDALCPSPRSGPRVMVGFWAVDGVPEGERPELTDKPFFTITYPVGGGDACYNWAHITDDPEEEPHPNSAQHIEWVDGHLKILQSTEFGCRPNLGRPDTPPNEKPLFWEVFQDFPTYLWGRIIATWEITDIRIRERTVLQFRAADNHFIGLSEDGSDDIVCAKRVPDDSCKLTARFPNYVWDGEGGSGDDGSFYLKADNGKYLRLKSSSDSTTLCADVDEADRAGRAALFTATFGGDGAVSLAVEEAGTLQHDPPFGKLYFTSGREADPTWAWFIPDYAQVSANGLKDWKG